MPVPLYVDWASMWRQQHNHDPGRTCSVAIESPKLLSPTAPQVRHPENLDGISKMNSSQSEDESTARYLNRHTMSSAAQIGLDFLPNNQLLGLLLRTTVLVSPIRA